MVAESIVTQEQLIDFSADDVTFRYRRCTYEGKD